MTPSQGLIAAGSVFDGAHVCESEWSDFLYDLARSHAKYMADHQKQGHQYFEQRFLLFYSGVYACLTLHTEAKQYKGNFPSV
jgi:hypothetical protein